jgi:N-acetyl-D-muramate 6-phosphate phosphatase
MSIQAVLLDLDGTLIDTAPDLAAALNHLLIEEAMPALPLQAIRPHVSRGALALIQLAFEPYREAHEIEPLRLRFLDYYSAHIADHSRLFDGFENVLSKLESKSIPWGIVTNKPAWLTEPLLQALNLDKRSAVTISADTTPQKKPHPLPLTTAAQRINVDCRNCMYIGDDPRDIIAGNAAQMVTVIAKYGYISDNTRLEEWQAQHCIEHPEQILEFITN